MPKQSIVSGSVYVFFRSADYPEYVSFIQWNPSSRLWGDPTTLFAMELFAEDPYKSNPKACYYNDQMYIFGRTNDGQISCIQYDGINVTDPMPIGAITGTSATPCVLNDQLYIVFPHGTSASNPVRVLQLDNRCIVQKFWLSTFYATYTDLAVLPISQDGQQPANISAWGNADGRLSTFSFFPSKINFNQTPIATPMDLQYSPCSVASGITTLFMCGDDGNLTAGILEGSNQGGLVLGTVTFDGIHPSSSPSAISLGGLNYLVFYGDGRNARTLKAAKLNFDGPNSTGIVQGILDFGVSLGPANCSPYAILIP